MLDRTAVMNNKKKLIICIELAIGVFFIVGAEWSGKTLHRLFHCYFADFFLPFGYYFLLVFVEHKYKIFEIWYNKALAVFLLCAASETLQYFSIYALARVFDPIDYVMYAAGALLAAIMDRVVFKRIFTFWE